MPDVLDEIINGLPPSVVTMILDFNEDYVNHAAKVTDLLDETQENKIQQVKKCLKRRTFDINAKTAKNKKCLDKLKGELEAMKSLKKPAGSDLTIKAYAAKINELEAQVKALTKDHDDIDLGNLFTNVEELYEEVKEYRKKVAEAKSKYECFDGFPPDIQQGKEEIAKVKERIKHHEAVVESLF